MTDIILEKINKHISNGLNREADVIYLLVQIRKVLEREELKEKYIFLALYCDWVLHPDIKGRKNEQILSKINLAVAALEDPEVTDYSNALETLNKAVSLDGLYEDMKRFFLEKNIYNEILHKDNWKNFGNNLIEILKDIPLVARGKKLISQFNYAEALDVSHSFRIRITMPDARVYTGPVQSVVGANWGIGVSAIEISPAPPKDDTDVY